MKTSFWNRLFDLVAPRTCAICDSRLSPSEEAVCAKCLLHLPLTHYELSPYDNPMARLFWGLLPVERAAALFFYEPRSEMAKFIYDLKYFQRPDIGVTMGTMATRLFAPHDFFTGIDAIVPVPITRSRRWHRGYNQSEQIAYGISSVTALPIYKKVVVRDYFTESQSHKNAMERRGNVANAFRLKDAEKIRGKHLLVVDDIVTTGSTVIACGEELCKAEGVKLSILSLGLTQ
jgi:ComF family protein